MDCFKLDVLNPQIQDSLRDLWHKIMSPRSGLELQSHRFRLKTYNNCLVGSELVDWLLTYEKAPNRLVCVMAEKLEAVYLQTATDLPRVVCFCYLQVASGIPVI